MHSNSISDWGRHSDVRGWMKWTLGVAGTLVLAFLLLFYTPPGLSLVGRLAAPLTGGQVRIAGLGGFFPSRLHAARLELADGAGVWLRIDDAALEWSAFALLGNHIDIDSVSARRIMVLRRPLPSQSPAGETPRLDIRPPVGTGHRTCGRGDRPCRDAVGGRQPAFCFIARYGRRHTRDAGRE